ncbi:solute carrier family 22 member 3-like [Asterias rubens]|uniref:solute carrier family 22 member 3-like n=1 Tax=Asterias rubens TaxID=7604 RepID=UPI0014557B6F|nr:solute carrier family 22 member 3-like [Asterias rubens]
MTSLLDDALHYIGKYGRYQVFACVIITIIGAWFPPLHIMGAIFSADRPISYHCIQWSDAGGNIVGSRPEKETTRVELSSDDVITSDECTGSLGFNNKTSEEVVCTDWKYDTEYNESTIVTQLDLVCDRKILVELSQTFLLFGMLVGSLLFGYLSDTFGRKRTLLGACLANGVIGIGVSFVWNYLGIVALWFLVGVCAQGYNQVQFVTIMEMFPPECRTLLGSCNTMFWGVGVASIAPIAYILRNWRDMQIAISVPCFVAVPLFCIIDDSVRWLLSTGRTDDAIIVINKMARCNGIAPPPGGFVLTKAQQDDDDLQQHDEESSDANGDVTETPQTKEQIIASCRVKDVFKNRRVLLNMCVVMFMW